MREQRRLLDRGSPIPLYYQLFLRIQTDMQSGIVRPGDLLGTEKDIQEVYGVSRATVRKALDELARSGRLVRVTGRGTFVAEPTPAAHTPHLLSFTEEMNRRGAVPGAQVLSFGLQVCPPDAAAALGCRDSDRVFHIRRLRTADGTPILLVDHYLPASIRLQEHDLGQSLYDTLESKLGIQLREAHHTIRACVSDVDESSMLGISPGEAVLRFHRTTMNAESRPVVYERGSARADMYEYSVHLFRQ